MTNKHGSSYGVCKTAGPVRLSSSQSALLIETQTTLGSLGLPLAQPIGETRPCVCVRCERAQDGGGGGGQEHKKQISMKDTPTASLSPRRSVPRRRLLSGQDCRICRAAVPRQSLTDFA
jgi:hypothetical protein